MRRRNEEEDAVLDELASHGILTWSAVGDEGVIVKLLRLRPGEGTRLLPLLSPLAQLVWRRIVEGNMAIDRMKMQQRGGQN